MKRFFVAALAVLLLVSCASKPQYDNYSFFAMDTFGEVRAYSFEGDKTAAFKSAQKIAEDVEKQISKTLEESPIYKLNSFENGSVELGEYLDELLTASMEISEVTDGCFEPMSGGLVELWERCEEEQRIPSSEELDACVSEMYNVKINKDENVLYKSGNVKFDFGAIGKGYAADKMVEDLKLNGVGVGMVTFVSTVAVFGDRDFKIAIRTPDTSGQTAGYITMRDEALSVSGDYERFYTINGVNYNHIIDPHTGMPVSNGIHSVAVVSDSAATADALSTAIFVMGSEKMTELYVEGILDFEALIITDSHVIVTPGMAEKFELVSNDYKLAEN